MVESAVGCEVARPRQIGGRRDPPRIVSFCTKALVVLFPVPAASRVMIFRPGGFDMRPAGSRMPRETGGRNNRTPGKAKGDGE